MWWRLNMVFLKRFYFVWTFCFVSCFYLCIYNFKATQNDTGLDNLFTLSHMLKKYPGATLDHIQNDDSPRIKFVYPCSSSTVTFNSVTGDVCSIEEKHFYICRACLIVSKGLVWRISETKKHNCPVHLNKNSNK